MLHKMLILTVVVLLLLLAGCTSKPVTKLEAWEDGGKVWRYVITLGDTTRTAVTADVYNEIYGYWEKMRLGDRLTCTLDKSAGSKLVDSANCQVKKAGEEYRPPTLGRGP